MKKFLLSQNTSFPFTNFGLQHILILILTILCFIIIYVNQSKLQMLNYKQDKKIRFTIIIVLLLNMFIYRVSYMYYGVYDIKLHLSLYLCHITNYLFVILLLINYKTFYKIIYGLSWISCFVSILYPSLSEGIDSFIFYTFFISHNLLLVFTTLMMVINNLKFSLCDCFKSIICAIMIIVFTYVVNYDFGTRFNTPNSILYNFDNLYVVNIYLKYLLLFLIGLIGLLAGYIINKIYSCRRKNEKSI